jgi:hypothetical protein
MRMDGVRLPGATCVMKPQAEYTAQRAARPRPPSDERNAIEKDLDLPCCWYGCGSRCSEPTVASTWSRYFWALVQEALKGGVLAERSQERVASS